MDEIFCCIHIFANMRIIRMNRIFLHPHSAWPSHVHTESQIEGIGLSEKAKMGTTA